jgi:hypothetical protein
MKINELARGNYVLDTISDLISVVETIGFEDTIRISNKFFQRESVKISERIKPIELTEDILLSSGFKIEKNQGDIKYFSIQRFFYYIVLDHGDVRLDMRCGKHLTYTVFYMDERFSYLHQLQNLYRCLTGKELEINL